MDLIKYIKIYYIFAIIFTNFALQSEALIDDLKEVIDLTANIETYLFGSEFLREFSKSSVELPIVKDKQSKVIARINLLDRELKRTVKKVRN